MGWLGSLITIVGVVVGNYFLPGLGGIIGGFIGGFVGAAVDPAQSKDPPTIDEIRAMGAEEGDPVQRLIGADVVVSADVVWRGPLLVKKPGVEGHPTNYFMPICFSFGRTFTGRPIKKIVEVTGNGQPIYWDYDEVNINGDDIAATLTTISAFNPGTGTTVPVQNYLDIASSGTSLIALDVGRDCVVAGFSNAGNNGTWRVVEVTGLTARFKSNTDPLHAFVTEAAGNDISLFQVADTGGIQDSGFSTVEISLGTPDQVAPGTVTFYEGAGNAPGWVGEILFCTNNLPLDPFGFSVPTVRARIRERDDTDLPSILKDVAVGMGIDECEIDTVDAAGIFYGFATRGPKSLQDVISPFLVAYNLVTQEKDMKLRVLHKLAATNVTVPSTALGAQDTDEAQPTPPFTVDREDPKRLPAEVEITYMDRNKRGEPATQPYRRLNLPLDNVMQINLPLMLDKDQTRKIAKRVCYGEEVAGERHGSALPPSMLDTYESDRTFTTSGGRERITLLGRMLIGQDYLLEFEGRRDDPAMYENETGAGGDSAGFEPPTQPTVDPLALALDMAPLHDDDVLVPLLRLGAVRESPQNVWSPAEIHESLGGSYGLVEQAEDEAMAGRTSGTVPAGAVGIWDVATSITVDFQSALPTSSTDDAVLTGQANWFQVGGEVIGAVTVTPVSATRATLSRLLRGLMGTDGQVSTHAANELVVRVRPFSTLARRVYTQGSVGTVRSYDACPITDTPDGVQAATLTLNASSVRPFPGTQAVGDRDNPSTNDWTVSWKPRTRRPLWPLFSGMPFDLVEATEDYYVEVWDAGFTTLKRTLTGASIDTSTPLFPEAVYTSAQQVTDFGSNQSTLRLRIFQVGDTGLSSKPYEVTIT